MRVIRLARQNTNQATQDFLSKVKMRSVFWMEAGSNFSRVLPDGCRVALRSEHQLLQSLINRKLFMRNGDVKILTPQETWDLITNLVEEALSPPEDDEEDDGI
jgi:hypothetical protein